MDARETETFFSASLKFDFLASDQTKKSVYAQNPRFPASDQNERDTKYFRFSCCVCAHFALYTMYCRTKTTHPLGHYTLNKLRIRAFSDETWSWKQRKLVSMFKSKKNQVGEDPTTQCSPKMLRS